ncbi:MAG: GNAT family N-acetyltransferase [Flavobacteriales bacterium]
MISIETQRLILRPHELRDIEPAYQMNLNQEVTRFTGDGGMVDLREIERRIKENVLGDYEKYGYGRFAVEWKETGEFIGFSGLKYLPDMREVDLGYRLKREFWGMGIATEAGKASLEFGFNHLGLQRIIAMLLPDNLASVRVLQKLGFRFERDMMEDGLLIHVFAIHNQPSS